MIAGLAIGRLPAPGHAATQLPVTVTATVISGFDTLGLSRSFGPFQWRGGLTLRSDAPAFGGLSGLVLDRNCERYVAVSDAGNWVAGELVYADGLLTGLDAIRMAPVLDSKGKPQRNKSWADAEALAPLGNGRLGVAFERKVRFGSYDIASKGLAAPFEPIPHPPPIDRGPENGEVEAFGLLATGQYIAIAERRRDGAGNIPAWIWRGGSVTSFSLEAYGRYSVTDLAVLPDGKVLTLERNLNRTSLPGMMIRRFDPKDVAEGKAIAPEVLLEASVPFYAIDNMEGISVCSRNGETRVTLQSDDNFYRSLQSTLLLQFAYTP